MIIVKLSLMYNEGNVNSATSGTNDNGWFGDKFKKALVDFGYWFVHGLFDLLSPFVEWGCKLVIVWCIVTMFCTKDTKSITAGLKAFLIFLVFIMIRGAIL